MAELVKPRWNSLRIILYYGAGSSIILGKHMEKHEIKIPSHSIGVKKEVTSTISIPLK